MQLADGGVTADDDGASSPPDDTDAAMTTTDVAAALSKLSLSLSDSTNSGDGGVDSLLSPQATKAALTLLSLTLSQGRVYRSDNCGDKFVLAGAIVDLVNYANDGGSGGGVLQLPAEATLFASTLVTLLGEALCPKEALLEDGGEAKSFLGRLIPLARISLCLSQGRLCSL